MNFPLHLSFKVIALAPQITVTDANNQNICYVRQKMMRLKEAVEVFTDKKKGEKICEIKANKILDISATYNFYDNAGNQFGAVRRKGLKSLWKAHYEILDHEDPEMLIREEKPWVKVIDGLIGEIPIIGLISGFIFHPSYLITRQDNGEEMMRVKKQSAFFESKFVIEKLGNFDEGDQMRMIISTLMMVLLERSRG